jgi:hypothetical protein
MSKSVTVGFIKSCSTDYSFGELVNSVSNAKDTYPW